MGTGTDRDPHPVCLGVVGIGGVFPVGGGAKLPYMRAEDLSDPLQQSRFGQLKVGGLPVVPIVQPLHHHGEVRQVDDSADTIGIQQGIGALTADPGAGTCRWPAIVGVAFIGWARPLLREPVVR